jgi:hypothetical protein
MKRTDYLITLGETWIKKYASINANSIKPEIEKSIWQAIKNAALSNIGILNFPLMINSDGATINFVVVRNDTLGFKSIKVLNFDVSPSNLTAKYQPLVVQIEKYLNKNWELFPSMYDGKSINYSQFAMNLTYKPESSGEMIAGD